MISTSNDSAPRDANEALAALRVRVDGVPSSKARELVRVAILPLARNYSNGSLSVTITASGGDGASRSDLDLSVLEGLRQLGLDHITLDAL